MLHNHQSLSFTTSFAFADREGGNSFPSDSFPRWTLLSIRCTTHNAFTTTPTAAVTTPTHQQGSVLVRLVAHPRQQIPLQPLPAPPLLQLSPLLHLYYSFLLCCSYFLCYSFLHCCYSFLLYCYSFFLYYSFLLYYIFLLGCSFLFYCNIVVATSSIVASLQHRCSFLLYCSFRSSCRRRRRSRSNSNSNFNNSSDLLLSYSQSLSLVNCLLCIDPIHSVSNCLDLLHHYHNLILGSLNFVCLIFLHHYFFIFQILNLLCKTCAILVL